MEEGAECHYRRSTEHSSANFQRDFARSSKGTSVPIGYARRHEYRFSFRMSLDTHAGRIPPTRRLTRTWGELTPEGEPAHVLRFVLTDRIVTILTDDLHRWEHLQGEPEYLILSTGAGQFTVEGMYLDEIRHALDLRRLTEIRANFTGGTRPGPRIRAITVE